ncbi:MAG: hypothetical protein ACWGOY_06525 [Anaerolineales bacterium]
MKTKFCLASVFAFVIFTACQSKPLDLDQYLVGSWKKADSRMVCQFHEDGTFLCADKDLLEDRPFDHGMYQLAGELMTFTSSEDSRTCPAGSGTYKIELTKEKQLIFTSVEEDDCWTRQGMMLAGGLNSTPSDYPWNRISP